MNEALGLDPDADATMPSRMQRMFSRGSTMAEQIRSAQQIAMALVKRGVLPENVLDELRKHTNSLFRAERKVAMAHNAKVYQDFYEKWANVPKSWLDASQRALENFDLEVPEGMFNGGTFEEFVSDIREMRRPSVDLLNEGLKKHGLEGVDPDLGAVHAKARRGTAVRIPVVGKMVSGTIDAVANIASELFGRQKGWMLLPDDKLIAAVQDNIRNSVRRVDGQYIIPKKKMPHLGTTSNGPTPQKLGLIKGVIEEGPNKGDFLIGDEADYQRFYEGEPKRFAENRAEFRNTYQEDEFQVSKLGSKFERKLPFLQGVHTASVLDYIDEARRMGEHGAAMLGQDVGQAEALRDLAAKISKAIAESPEDIEALRSLRKALWGEKTQDGVGETSLAFRAYQQLGRVSQRDRGLFARIEAAARPAAYDIALNTSATAAAKQGVQNVAQGFQFGVKRGLTNAGGLVKRSVQAPFAAIGLAPKLSEDIAHSTATGWGGFGSGNAAQEATIRAAAPYALAEHLANPNSRRALRNYYSDAELRMLEDNVVDGRVDMKQPEVQELVEGQVRRDLEAIMGSNSNTSQPAMFQSLPTAVRMFKSTPAQILTSSFHLFSPGGLMDQGSPVKNLLARRKLAYLVGSWAAAKAISGTVKGKAGALALTAAAPTTALFMGLRAVASGDNDSEERSKEITKALFKSLLMQGDGGLGDAAKAAGILVSSASLSNLFPGASPDALIDNWFLNETSRADLGLGRRAAVTGMDVAEAVMPATGIVAGTLASPFVEYGKSFQGEPEVGKTTKLYAGSSLEQALYLMRKLPVVRDATWRSGHVIPMRALRPQYQPSQVDRIETEQIRK